MLIDAKTFCAYEDSYGSSYSHFFTVKIQITRFRLLQHRSISNTIAVDSDIMEGLQPLVGWGEDLFIVTYCVSGCKHPSNLKIGFSANANKLKTRRLVNNIEKFWFNWWAYWPLGQAARPTTLWQKRTMGRGFLQGTNRMIIFAKAAGGTHKRQI